MFSSFGAEVTLVVSRQQVLPGKDPEVAAVLEDDFLRRGVKLLMGARAEAIERVPDTDGVVVRCDDGRVGRVDPRRAGHRLDPQHRRARPRRWPASRSTAAATSRSTTTASRRCRTSTPPATSAASCRCRRWRRCRAARSPSTLMGLHARVAPPPRLRQGGLGDLHRARDRRRRSRRGRGVQLRPQDPGHQGAVLGDRQGADQQRHAGLRQDHLRPGDRRGARRVDRRPPGRRADLGASPSPSPPTSRSATSSRASSCTPPSAKPSPKPPSNLPDAGDVVGD